MINAKDHYVAWALMVSELDEAVEHLQKLTASMASAGSIEEEDLEIQLGHVYAHLNRAWHSRNREEEVSSEEWGAFSQFPKDVTPVG